MRLFSSSRSFVRPAGSANWLFSGQCHSSSSCGPLRARCVAPRQHHRTRRRCQAAATDLLANTPKVDESALLCGLGCYQQIQRWSFTLRSRLLFAVLFFRIFLVRPFVCHRPMPFYSFLEARIEKVQYDGWISDRRRNVQAQKRNNPWVRFAVLLGPPPQW
jgi:hypothetical protein